MEYLERLLADVERHKQLSNSSSLAVVEEKQQPAADPQTRVNRDKAENNLINCESLVGLQNAEPSAPPLPVREDISKLQDKCVSELSSTLSSCRRPRSEIPRSPEKVLELRRNSNPDVPSNYITVIEVTGSTKKDKSEEATKEGNEKGERS